MVGLCVMRLRPFANVNDGLPGPACVDEPVHFRTGAAQARCLVADRQIQGVSTISMMVGVALIEFVLSVEIWKSLRPLCALGHPFPTAFRFLVIARQRHAAVGGCDVVPVPYEQRMWNTAERSGLYRYSLFDYRAAPGASIESIRSIFRNTRSISRVLSVYSGVLAVYPGILAVYREYSQYIPEYSQYIQEYSQYIESTLSIFRNTRSIFRNTRSTSRVLSVYSGILAVYSGILAV
jgi:hypothetical protein